MKLVPKSFLTQKVHNLLQSPQRESLTNTNSTQVVDLQFQDQSSSYKLLLESLPLQRLMTPQ